MAWLVADRLKPYAARRSEPYLTESIKKQVAEKYFPRYPRKQAALLPLFHILMHEYGFIPLQAIDEAAEFLELPRAVVQDAVSFYEEFRLQPSGEYVINVCRSISCELCGSRQVLEKIRDVFGIDPGETTDDHKITVLEVECLGACEQAPCALVNENLHGNLEPESFVKQLQQLPAHSRSGVPPLADAPSGEDAASTLRAQSDGETACGCPKRRDAASTLSNGKVH